MTQKMKQLMGSLLGFAMMLGLMLGMSLTAYADEPIYNPASTYTGYGTLKTNGTKVKFNDFEWYIIADNSADTKPTVTLLSADTKFGTYQFKSDGSSNSYNGSDVKGYLDKIVAGTAGDGKPNFKGVADAIEPVTLTTNKYNSSDVPETTTDAKLYLLSTVEAKDHANFNFEGAQYGGWWLRSPGRNDYLAAFVGGDLGYVYDVGDDVPRPSVSAPL